MTGLPLPAVALLVVAAFAASALAGVAAVRQLVAGAALRARARRSAALRPQPAAELYSRARLEREAVDASRPIVRLAQLCGLLAPGERTAPRLRLALFALFALGLTFLLARAGLAFPAALPAGLLVAAGAFRWRRWRAATAVTRAFEVQLPEAIGLMVRCVRAGVPVGEALSEAGTEMAAPAGPLFAAADRKVRLGRQLEDALWDLAAAVRVAEFDFLCVAVAVQRETGGNLAETLAGLEATVRKRLTLRLKVKALTSEARASALIIGALPLLMGAGLALLAPDYLAPLFETGPGRLLLATAVGSLVIGAGLMSHLVRRETAAP